MTLLAKRIVDSRPFRGTIKQLPLIPTHAPAVSMSTHSPTEATVTLRPEPAGRRD
jgi:hypothetical protein